MSVMCKSKGKSVAAYFKRFLLPCVAAAVTYASVMSSASAKTNSLPANAQLERGIAAAQTCETELDDDLTPYGECIGHAADRLSRQQKIMAGLYFQAWLIADLAARQGSTRAAQLRLNQQQALTRSLRSSGLSVQQLCKLKSLECGPVLQRLNQKIAPN